MSIRHGRDNQNVNTTVSTTWSQKEDLEQCRLYGEQYFSLIEFRVTGLLPSWSSVNMWVGLAKIVEYDHLELSKNKFF